MTDEKVNILVVDDLPEKLLVMETVLAEVGANVIMARSGEEALRQVLRYEFAVILLDVNMPSMDGYETAALIRKRRRSAHTPIIFITGYADEVHKAQGYQLGAVDYILSPVNPDILRTKVRVFIELFQMMQQAKRHADERVARMQAEAARLAAEAAREMAEAAHQRSSFLAESSATLAGSLDHITTARALARLAVPFLADFSFVCAGSPRGELGRAELAWTRTADGAVSSTSLEAEALPQPLIQATRRALSTGRSELIEDLKLDAGAGLYWEEPPAGSPFVLTTALVLPLRARASRSSAS
jgi:CheY-like chemotaxis protein